MAANTKPVLSAVPCSNQLVKVWLSESAPYCVGICWDASHNQSSPPFFLHSPGKCPLEVMGLFSIVDKQTVEETLLGRMALDLSCSDGIAVVVTLVLVEND